MSVCVEDAQKGQKSALYSLELEFQAVVSCLTLTWVLSLRPVWSIKFQNNRGYTEKPCLNPCSPNPLKNNKQTKGPMKYKGSPFF